MGMGEQPWHLDAYNKFFKTWSFQPGQGIAATTLTAGSAAGATTLAVTSNAGLINGTVLVMGEGTAQQTVKVASGGGTTALTLTAPLEFAVSSGAAVTPLWADSGHRNLSPGWKAWARFIMEARRPDGTRVINKSGKIVFFGNSWMTPSNQANYESQVHAVYPGATVVMAGISSNTSAMMLARFDTDVPADADFVVMPEPGVNDIQSDTSRQTILDNLIKLTKKVWGIGAVPVFTGGTPVSDKLAISARLSVDYSAAFATPETFPAPGPSASVPPVLQSLPYGSVAYEPRAAENSTQDSQTAIGNQALRNTTGGLQNTAVGQYAAIANTTGNYNTAVGQGTLAAAVTAGSNTAIGRAALANCTVSNNTAVGDEALKAATTGNNNTALGRRAGAAVTTGTTNTIIGANAGEAPNFVTGNATTTGGAQTSWVPTRASHSATQRANVTAIGPLALVGADDATALGHSANAGHARSVALGKGATTTAADQVMVGGRDEEITDAVKGVVLKSPNGTRYRITVTDTGVLSVAAV